MKKTILILMALWAFSSCCPKYTPSVEIIHKTDTLVIDSIVEVFVPPVSDTIGFDAISFCDSLRKAHEAGINPVFIHRTFNGHARAVIDPSKNIIICETDSLQAEVNKRDLIIHDLTERNETVVKEVKVVPTIWKVIAGIAVFELLLLAILFKLK